MRSAESRKSHLHNLLVANMALGVAVFAVAIYFMITGEYANLAARQATEAMLNGFAIGGLLYSAASWYVDQFVLATRHKLSANKA